MSTTDLQKIKERNRRIAYISWKRGDLINKAMPIRATLNTTLKCNLNCIMCQFHRNKKISERVIQNNDELHVDLFLDFADQVFPTLIEAETTTVGEPLLSSYLDEIIEKALEYNVLLYFTTNGLLLKEELISKLIPTLSNLVISIDAVNHKLYEKIRKGSCFAKLEKNIKKFIEIRNSCEKYKPELTLQMTLMKMNIEELPKMVQYANKIGANNVKAYHAYIFEKKMKNQSLFYHREIAEKFIKEAKTLGKKLGVNTFLPRFFPENCSNIYPDPIIFDFPPCFFLWYETFIEPNGDISPCFFPTRQKIGNIKERTFNEIWNNRQYQIMRREVIRQPPKGYCKNCELRYTYLKDYTGPGIIESQFILIDDKRARLYQS